MTTHLGLQRILLPSAQVSQLTTGSITLPSARGVFEPDGQFEPIASLTGAGTSAIFDNIPQTYLSLQIRGMVNTAGSGFTAKVNGLGGSNYNNFRIRCSYDSANSESTLNTSSWIGGAFASINTGYPGAFICDIHDYAVTTKFKTMKWLFGYNDNSVNQDLLNTGSGLFKSTAAITSITFDYIASGTELALYGIKGA